MQRTVLRLIAAGAAVAATAMLAFTTPASAQEADGPGGPEGPEGEVLEVDGDFTGTGSLRFDCDFLGVVAESEGDWTAVGPSTLDMEFCNVDTGGVRSPISDATFEIATDEGTLSGSMTGWVDSGLPFPADEFPFLFELTVDEGTGRFADSTGTLTLDGAFGPAAGTNWGTVSGTVTLPPPIASSLQDCLHGGWRHVVDDDGAPFRNQGLCVSFVRHL